LANVLWASARSRLWRDDARLAKSPWGRVLLRLLRTSVIAGKGFWNDECMLRATALAYTTLLSLVPLLAVAFSLFAAFPELENAYSEIRSFLNEYLAPGASKAAISALNEFIANATTGTLAGIGTAALFVTVFLMLSSIEESLNRIWRAPKTRPILDRLIYYLAIVILGPLFLAVSVNAAIQTVQQETLALKLVEPPFVSELWEYSLPLLASCALFTILFKAMPNTKVRWPAAIAGGIISGVLFEIAKKAYTLYASNAIAYRTIYGAMSTVPLFLVWIYVIWLVVLFGAEFAHGWQTVLSYQRIATWGPTSQYHRELLATALAVATTRRFEEGKPGLTSQEMADIFDAPLGIVEEIVETLKSSSVLTESGRGILPAKDPDKLTLWDVVGPLRRGAESRPIPEQLFREEVGPAVLFIDEVQTGNEEPFRSVTLAELAARSAVAETTPDRRGQ